MEKSAKNTEYQKRPLDKQFLHPKYIGIWGLAGVFRVLVYLPLPIQLQLGKHLGNLCYRLLKSRRHTTEVNIALCFPSKSEQEQAQLVKEIFQNAGAGIFESLCAWWNPKKFDGLMDIEGLEHIKASQENDKAVLLLGLHSTVLDLGGLLISQYINLDAVYRPQDSKLMDWFVFNGRHKFFGKQVAAKQTLSMIKRLRANKTLWYSPDQDYGLKHGVMSTFFGVPAATITAGRRMAQAGKADVMAIHFYRTTGLYGKARWKKPHYQITITPKLEQYPSNDEHADAKRINTLLEALISKDISQYMWFHRRFKSQADGTQFYKK